MTDILLQETMEELAPQPPAPVTRRSALSGPHTICSMRAVVTGKQAFETATVLVHLKKDGWIGLLGIEYSRASSIVVDKKNSVQHDSLNDTVLEDRRYQQTITDLHDGNPTSWEGVLSNENHDRVGCVCGQTFNTIVARDIHVHSGLVGSHYDIAPEARPRLAAAWLLLDVDKESVFQAVIAAGTQGLCSRGCHVESSTSAEQRTVLCALQDVKGMSTKNSALLLSTDSDSTRQAIEECCLWYC